LARDRHSTWLQPVAELPMTSACPHLCASIRQTRSLRSGPAPSRPESTNQPASRLTPRVTGRRRAKRGVSTRFKIIEVGIWALLASIHAA